MKMRALGRTGALISIIGQGTWNMERDDRRQAVRALQRGLDLGMNHIDTAEMYGSGEVERIVAEAVSDRRAEAFIASKVLPDNASYEGTLRACERSLKRLKTDYVDLYLLHWPGSHPLEETFRAFSRLTAQGKIRAYGVSNFAAGELEKALSVAPAEALACNQVLYHLLERTIEHEVIPACERHGVAVVAYSPFGSGRFPSPKSRGGAALSEMAEARGVTPRQIALAFLNRRDSLFTIPKASQIAHVEENARAAELILCEEEVQRLEQAFPRGPRRRGVPML